MQLGAAFPNIVKGGSKRFTDYLQDTKQITVVLERLYALLGVIGMMCIMNN